MKMKKGLGALAILLALTAVACNGAPANDSTKLQLPTIRKHSKSVVKSNYPLTSMASHGNLLMLKSRQLMLQVKLQPLLLAQLKSLPRKMATKLVKFLSQLQNQPLHIQPNQHGQLNAQH